MGSEQPVCYNFHFTLQYRQCADLLHCSEEDLLAQTTSPKLYPMQIQEDARNVPL